jgi:hypothetical protein
VPTFLVGGTAGLVRPAPISRRERRKAAEAAAVPVDDRPVWARTAVPEAAEPAEKKPGRISRMIGALGNAWGQLPERLSRASSSGPKTASFTPPASLMSNGNGNGNGHKPQKAHKSKKNDSSVVGASLHSWVGAGGKGSGSGKGSTSHPGGWNPGSLNAAGSRFAKK